LDVLNVLEQRGKINEAIIHSIWRLILVTLLCVTELSSRGSMMASALGRPSAC